MLLKTCVCFIKICIYVFWIEWVHPELKSNINQREEYTTKQYEKLGLKFFLCIVVSNLLQKLVSSGQSEDTNASRNVSPKANALPHNTAISICCLRKKAGRYFSEAADIRKIKIYLIIFSKPKSSVRFKFFVLAKYHNRK